MIIFVKQWKSVVCFSSPFLGMSLLGIIGGLGMQMLKKGLIVGLAILLYFNNGVGSDHCPLLIEEDPISDGGGGGGRRRRRFMFEEMWL